MGTNAQSSRHARSGQDFAPLVQITEVGPRDGLQAEARLLPASEKIALIEKLIAAGIRDFEITSFVSPRAVPQMADAAEIVAAFKGRDELLLSALVPNTRGAENAAEAGVDAMVLFMSASESHNLKNVNRTRGESLAGFEAVAEVANNSGTALHGAISTAFGCPFEGIVPVEEVMDLARAYAGLGVRRISLGDTTGMATPPLVIERVRALRATLPEVEIALHFHNTRGVGLVCAWVGLAEGVTRFEASVGGLGGCPFVPEATGNICTEDLVYMLEESGYLTGIDLEKLSEAARLAEHFARHPLPGQFMKAGPRLRTWPMEAAKTANG